MKITFLGTGSSQGVPVISCTCPTCASADPRDNRLRSSIHLTQQGKNILIDAGPDLRYQALRAGIQEVDALLITHEHRDHTGGLSEIRSTVLRQEQPVAVYARDQVLEHIQRDFHYLFTPTPQHWRPSFELHEIKKRPFEAFGVAVTPIQVYHNTLPIWGFRIDEFTYITDAKVIPEEEIAKLQGTRVLVVNALRKESHPAHFNLEEALALAQKVGAKVTYLTHISHQMGLHAEVSQELPDNVYLAYDGLQLSV
ncbi:MAG: MBL fold metallo-hydrolase [Bacteroidota bacterium]